MVEKGSHRVGDGIDLVQEGGGFSSSSHQIVIFFPDLTLAGLCPVSYSENAQYKLLIFLIMFFFFSSVFDYIIFSASLFLVLCNVIYLSRFSHIKLRTTCQDEDDCKMAWLKLEFRTNLTASGNKQKQFLRKTHSAGNCYQNLV